ncbi:MAG: potassium channel family protein [Actinomycetes bacterium]
MTRQQYDELPKRQRRRLLWRAMLRPALTATGLLLAYYLLPMNRSAAATLLAFTAGLLAVGGLLVWQVRAIVGADFPRIRAIEALATTLPLFIVLFASCYFIFSRQAPSSFTEKLSRTDALYFTVTVFSSVGFGDITPVTEGARVVVMVQMMGDLLLVGLAAKVILDAVQVGLRRQGVAPVAQDGPAGVPSQAAAGDKGADPQTRTIESPTSG